jgi:flagellar assembly protein FliH
MSTTSPITTDVLRGLPLAETPLRLGRANAGVAAAPAAAEDRAREEAFQQAYAQAVREGREEGVRAGRGDGLREGRAQAAEEIRQAVQRAVAEAVLPVQAQRDHLEQLARRADAAIADLLHACEDDMVALCYETICRIVGADAVDPDRVRAQLAQLVSRHAGSEASFHVHPHDAHLLQVDAVRAPDGRPRWVPDPEVALGGCVVKSASGVLDARLETILASCKATLLEARRQRSVPAAPGEGA